MNFHKLPARDPINDSNGFSSIGLGNKTSQPALIRNWLKLSVNSLPLF